MRLAPDGIAGRLALLLAVALLAANALALVLVATERDRIGREARIEATLERLVGTVPLIETLPPRAAQRNLRRIGRRGLDVALTRTPEVTVQGTGGAERALARRIADELGGGREVRVALARRGGEARRGQSVSVSIELRPAAGGSAWLNARFRPPPGLPRSGQGLSAALLFVGLSLAAVLGVALLYVRRLVRPLHALAEAARAAGRGDRTARVPEAGARELREAALAFNAMQARIARFDAERTRTLAAVGHDLRTPITSLRIRAEMLDDEQREPMVRTLDEMRVMADGLVAYARGEGDGEATERVDLAALLERLCEERGAMWGGGENATVDARPVALARALGNLIDNAIRYAGDARVSLARADGQAVIAVEDEGPGIPPERLEAVLEPFVRGDASRSTETGGTGLGLSIARAVLTAHGGSLGLANRPNGGLRAEARLPLAEDG